jgi:Protein of unknown function (DUF4236)
MGSVRFRRSIRVAPGVKLNINKKSVSLTGGVRGAHVTRSFGGRSNYSVGAPGTGLWYRGYFGGRRRARGGPSLGQALAAAPAGTGAAKVASFLVWLGGLLWLLPVAAIVAAIFGGLHNFGAAYLVLVVGWTAWRVRRSRTRSRKPAASPVEVVTPLTPAQEELRAYWKSLLADGLYTDADEQALNDRLEELGLSGDGVGLDAGNDGPFADLIWRSKIAKAAAGPLPSVENPSLLVKPGETVHLEMLANLTRKHTASGFTSFEPDDNGTLSITSTRIVFAGESRGLDISYRRLNGASFWGDSDGVIGELALHSFLVLHDTQRTSCLFLGLGNADLAAAVIKKAAADAS